MKETEAAKRREQWRVLVEELKGMNCTVKAFCAERGVTYHGFKYWQKKFREESGYVSKKKEAAPFREITPLMERATTYAVTLRCGRCLRVEESFSETNLRKLIEILESC